MNKLLDFKICKNCKQPLFMHMEHMFESSRGCPIEGKYKTWYIGVNYVPWKMTNLEYLEYLYEKKHS